VAVILEASGLNKNFGAVIAASNITAAFEQDAVVGLIGTNGAGKTTFVNMVTGYLEPDSGTITFQGRDITRLEPRDITQLGICRSFQIPQLYNSLSVLDNLLVGFGILLRNAGLGGYFAAADPVVPGHGLRSVEAADRLLERFGLTAYRDKTAQVLPGGIRKLLDICMAMVVKPKVLLLDEPTSGVAAEEKFGIMDLIMQAVRAEGATVLFVEHDMEVVSRYSQRVLAFYDGRIICDAPPEVALNDEEVRKYVVGRQHGAAAGKADAHA
jgi:branched-chain amino acid transport system ATP-binding protein